MALLRVDTPEGLLLTFPLAGAGSRTLAATIDLAIFVAAFLFVLFVTLPTLGSGVVQVLGAGGILAFIGYPLLCRLTLGETPGKLLLGLRVVDARGFPATPMQVFLRSLFLPVEWIAMPLPIGLMVLAASRHRQRLGDWVAATFVLAPLRGRVAPAPLAPRRPHEEGRSGLRAAHVARFRRGDLEFLHELLGRVDLEPAVRRRLILRAARTFAGRLGGASRNVRSLASARAFLEDLYVLLDGARERLRG